MRTARFPFLSAGPMIAAILSAGLALGCADREAVPSETAPSLTVEDRANISEAVWRHLMKSPELANHSFWFLWLERGDPPADLLERFAGVAARPGSLYEHGDGVLLHVESIAPIPGGALVRASWTTASLSAMGYDYTLRQEAGAWRVIEEELRWIS